MPRLIWARDRSTSLNGTTEILYKKKGQSWNTRGWDCGNTSPISNKRWLAEREGLSLLEDTERVRRGGSKTPFPRFLSPPRFLSLPQRSLRFPRGQFSFPSFYLMDYGYGLICVYRSFNSISVLKF